MIQLGEKQTLPEWPGFIVYDAETGENLSDNYIFFLNQDGELVKPVKNGSSVVFVTLQKRRKYLIQFADSGKYMVW